MYKRILVPVDGSETSNRAVIAALQLARESGGSVRFIHVLDDLAHLPGDHYSALFLDQAREYATRCVGDAMAIANSWGVAADSKLLDTGGRRLGEVVADEARGFKADLVAVGTHGRRGVNRVLLGSGAEQVIRLAPVPVLAVRPPQTAASG